MRIVKITFIGSLSPVGCHCHAHLYANFSMQQREFLKCNSREREKLCYANTAIQQKLERIVNGCEWPSNIYMQYTYSITYITYTTVYVGGE